MSAPESYSPRLTTLQATVDAEQLLTAFHNCDSDFTRIFFQSDRDTLGAVIAYADLAIRGLARASDETAKAVLQQLRLTVSDSQSSIERQE